MLRRTATQPAQPYAPPITVQFNKAITAATVSSSTVSLLDPAGHPVLTTVTYDGWTNRATIIPRTALAGRSIYTIRPFQSNGFLPCVGGLLYQFHNVMAIGAKAR